MRGKPCLVQERISFCEASGKAEDGCSLEPGSNAWPR